MVTLHEGGVYLVNQNTLVEAKGNPAPQQNGKDVTPEEGKKVPFLKAIPHNDRLQISKKNCTIKSLNFLLILGGLAKILPNLWGDFTRKLVARYCAVLP